MIGELDTFFAGGEQILKLGEQAEPMHAFNWMMELVGDITKYIVDKTSTGLLGECKACWLYCHLITSYICIGDLLSHEYLEKITKFQQDFHLAADAFARAIAIDTLVRIDALRMQCLLYLSMLVS